VVETNLCTSLLIFDVFCLLPFCFFAASFSPSSCLTCFSNCSVATKFLDVQQGVFLLSLTLTFFV